MKARAMKANRIGSRTAGAFLLALAAGLGWMKTSEREPLQDTRGIPPRKESTTTTYILPEASEPKRAVVRSLGSGGSHIYTATLEAGQALRVEVEQQGADLAVELKNPRGLLLLRVDNNNGPEGAETLAIVAEDRGLHSLEIHASESQPEAEYQVRVLRSGLAEAADRQRAVALNEYWKGEALRSAPDTRAEALDAYRRAEDVWHSLGDEPLALARARRRIARILCIDGQIQDALVPLQQALSVFRDQTNGWELTPLLNEAGYAYMQSGEPFAARTYFSEALQLSLDLGHRPAAASALNGLGILNDRLGQFEEALRAYDGAAEHLRDLGQWEHLARTLHNRGVAYHSAGFLPEAFEHLERALELRRHQQDKRGEAHTLTALGLAYGQRGDDQRALEHYRRALGLHRTTKDVLGEAATLGHLGSSLERLGRFDEALDHHREALEVLRDTNYRLSQAQNQMQLGRVLLAQEDPDRALHHAEKGLELSRQISDLQGQSAALVTIAQVEQRKGHLHAAKDHLELALDLVEDVRGRLQGVVFRRSYLARRYDDYGVYVNLLMELDRVEPGSGYAAQAFEAAERVRARGLEDGLASNPGWREGVAPELERRERLLRERIQSREALRRDWVLEGGTDARVQVLEAEIEALLEEYRKLDGDLRRSAGPEAVASASPMRLSTVQRELLDDETTLLAYHLGDQESYLWVVDPTRVQVHRLPRRSTLEALIQEVMKHLTESDAPGGARRFAESASHLTAQILASALPDLTGRRPGRRLVILADGLLATLPFAALPLAPFDPQRNASPLVERFELVSLPSTAVLDLLRKRDKEEPSKLLALFGDPVFDPEDHRWTGAPSPLEKTPLEIPALTRVTRSWDLGKIVRLHHAGREADAILALVKDTRQRFAALGFRATRSAVLDADLENYRFLHFATHGFNARHPSLSGLVLSLFDQDGNRIDGFLRVHEIERLHLNADLVVLSACRTALGEEVRGEGMVGMSQAFFRAGARALLVSHWSVEDRATAALMKRFYSALLDGQGLPPAAALREAQRSLRAEAVWEAPYFWAGFTLQGDWQTGSPLPLDRLR